MSARPAGRHIHPSQLQLELDGPPRTAQGLLERLRELGLTSITECRLTDNRTVMVSVSGHMLRVHRGYLEAPAPVLRAIVSFVRARTRAERRAAQRVIVAFPVHAAAPPASRRERTRPDDELLVRELAAWHRQLNAHCFDGTLHPITIRISSRMRSRLGQYTAASPHGGPAEIAISRAHIRQHGWAEALHTLLHEMVHQWQAEHGHELDHGPTFRAKATAVGIAPHARRELHPRRSHPHPERRRRAARDG